MLDLYMIAFVGVIVVGFVAKEFKDEILVKVNNWLEKD